MAELTLTPDVPNAESLELINGPTIMVAQGPESLKLPVPSFEESFAESSDTEGGRKIRSRPLNAEGGGKVYFDAPGNSQEFFEALDMWQTTIAALDKHGGTISYEPPQGTPVTYEVESAHITSLPQDGVMLNVLHAESEWMFTARPYGLLDPQTITPTPVTSTNPLLEMEVPNVLGSVDALGRLILTDLEGQDRSHVVFGLDTSYDPDNPTPTLLTVGGAGEAGLDDSFAGTSTTRAGSHSTNVLRTTLSTTELVCLGSGTQRHIGTWRVLARVYGAGSGPIWCRNVYKLGSSPRFSEGDWRELPGFANWYELDLGLMRVTEAPQGTRTCEFRLEAYSEIAGDTLDVDYCMLIPQPGGKVRTELSVGTPTGSSGPNSPDTVADDAAVGSLTWSNPGNAVASDDSRATTAASGFAYTHYLKATDFDFAIPAAATVTGIKVEIERSQADLKETYDSTVKLVEGGTIQGINHASASRWPTVDAYEVYGGESDLWGLTLVGSDINATNFGVAISVGVEDITARVDHIRITAYYTEAPDEPDRVLHASQSMEIRSDMVIRETPTTEWGRLATEGAYLKIPPAGREGRTYRLVVRARRNDVDSLPDAVVDDELSAVLTVTPRVTLLAN